MTSNLKPLPVQTGAAPGERYPNDWIIQIERSYRMKRIALLLVAVATAANVVYLMGPPSGRADAAQRLANAVHAGRIVVTKIGAALTKRLIKLDWLCFFG
jgi:hypothetical protein